MITTEAERLNLYAGDLPQQPDCALSKHSRTLGFRILRWYTDPGDMVFQAISVMNVNTFIHLKCRLRSYSSTAKAVVCCL